jgi:hypothetical protein
MSCERWRRTATRLPRQALRWTPAGSFDHLVGGGQERFRNGEPELFRLITNSNLVGWITRKAGGLFSLENAAGIDGLAINIDLTR